MIFIKTVKLLLISTLLLSCTNEVSEEDLDRMEGDTTLTFLALGDSYTIGESVDENERWPVQLVDSLINRGYAMDDPVIIATTGWRTDQLKDAVENHPDGTYDMVSLLIGVNDQYQSKPVENYPQNFETLLDIAIERAGGIKEHVFVVSIPDYGYTPFGAPNQEKISTELDEYNAINREIAEKLGVQYFYITGISRSNNTTLVASDGLHPSGKQYALWVSKMLEEAEFFQFLENQ